MSIARMMQMARAGVPTGGGDVWTDPDLANASYDSVSFSVGDCLGMDFSEDGSNLYVNNLTFPGGDITQYSLSTPWDISTASSTGNSLDTDAQEDVPYGIKFSPDGTKLFVAGDLTDSIYEYTLSTAWDISTATYSSNSLSISAQETSVDDLAFNIDGSKLFILGSSSNSIFQYSLPSSYSLASASYDAVSFSVSAQTVGTTSLFLAQMEPNFLLLPSPLIVFFNTVYRLRLTFQQPPMTPFPFP